MSSVSSRSTASKAGIAGAVTSARRTRAWRDVSGVVDVVPEVVEPPQAERQRAMETRSERRMIAQEATRWAASRRIARGSAERVEEALADSLPDEASPLAIEVHPVARV